MSQDSLIPRWDAFQFGKSERSEGAAQVSSIFLNVYRTYAIIALPVIAGYSLFPSWQHYTLGVTFACGYVFLMSSLAALVLWRQGLDKTLIQCGVRPSWIPALFGCAVIGFLAPLLIEATYAIPEFSEMGLISLAWVLIILGISAMIVYRHRFMDEESIERANQSLRRARIDTSL